MSFAVGEIIECIDDDWAGKFLTKGKLYVSVRCPSEFQPYNSLNYVYIMSDDDTIYQASTQRFRRIQKEDI